MKKLKNNVMKKEITLNKNENKEWLTKIAENLNLEDEIIISNKNIIIKRKADMSYEEERERNFEGAPTISAIRYYMQYGYLDTTISCRDELVELLAISRHPKIIKELCDWMHEIDMYLKILADQDLEQLNE